MKVTLAGLLVDDQDKALRFYTKILGFQVKTNTPYAPGVRWLTVVAPNNPGGAELQLALADEDGLTYQRAQYEKGKTAIAFSTDDCRAEAEALKTKGVVFTMEPTKQEYGGIDAVFDDTCGNYICLHQD